MFKKTTSLLLVILFFLQIRVVIGLRWIWLFEGLRINFLFLSFLRILQALILIYFLCIQIQVGMFALALTLFLFKYHLFFYHILRNWLKHATFQLTFLIYLLLLVILYFCWIFLLFYFIIQWRFSSKIWLIYRLVYLTNRWSFFILFFFFLI